MLITYRFKTTDEKVIKEVINNHCYFNNDVQPSIDDYWLDLGGNIGCFFIPIFDKIKCCISLEPEYENFNIMKLNIKNNNINNVLPLNIACTYSGTESLLYLCKNPNNKYRHSVIKIKNRDTIPIKSICFLELLEQYPEINCIKMDIEGAEMEILEKYNEWNRFNKICFEWDFDRDKSIKRFYNVIDKLSNEFIIYHQKIDRNNIKFSYFPTGVVVLCLNKKLHKTCPQ